jgi:hypothetical protein
MRQDSDYSHRLALAVSKSPLPLTSIRWSPLRRQRHIETTCLPSRHTRYTDTQSLRTHINLPIRISFPFVTLMTRWQFLCSVSDDLEDVDCEAIGSVVELLVESLSHVLALNGDLHEWWDERLRIPVCKACLNGGEFFFRVDGAVGCVFVFKGGVGVNCRFCGGC